MPFHIAPDIIIDATLYILLVFSLITWTLIFFKIWQFTKNSYYNKQFNAAFGVLLILKQQSNYPPKKPAAPKPG